MALINLNLMDFCKRKKKWELLRQNEYLNLPDLEFFHWCQSRYQVNRGVYNTIDCWFYNSGMNEIIVRRILLLAFLNFVHDANPHQAVRFGNGGLTRKLHQFIDEMEKN